MNFRKRGYYVFAIKFRSNEKKSFQDIKTICVAKVHGGHHPEFHEVHKTFDAIIKKTEEAGTKIPELNEEFAHLREITDNYTLPGDVCESYEAVYKNAGGIGRSVYGKRELSCLHC